MRRSLLSLVLTTASLYGVSAVTLNAPQRSTVIMVITPAEVHTVRR